MADIQVDCGYCGHTFSVADDVEGSSAACPACGRPTLVIEARGEGDTSSLQLKTTQGAGETRKDCPACGAAAENDAVICINCGYNWNSGQVQKQLLNAQSDWKKYIPYVVIALLAGLAIYLFVGRQSKSSGVVQPTPPIAAETTPASETTLETTPTEPETVAEPEEATEMNVDEVGTKAFDEEQAEGKSDDTTTLRMSDDKLAAFEEECRLRFTAKLDRNKPLFTQDEEIAVRRSSGMVQRGRFIGVKEQVMVLALENSVIEIPLKELDRTTRVRCDKHFRRYMIESQVKKRIKQLTDQ